MYTPNRGGRSIPKNEQQKISTRIRYYANKHYSRLCDHLGIKYRGPFCYIDVFNKPVIPKGFSSREYGCSKKNYIERLKKVPMHLCRLRYFGDIKRMSLAIYFYGDEKYLLRPLENGEYQGTPEKALEIAGEYIIKP